MIPNHATWEREFLIRLAPIYLGCRWRVMGNDLGGDFPKPDLAFDLLGMVDYSAEMKLVCQARLRSTLKP